jgi:glycosyltransferase involved in cell wall biosynthesis
MKKKKILFIHQNFPGQYKNLAPELAKDKNYEISSLSMKKHKVIPDINQHVYSIEKGNSLDIHKFAVEFETKIIRADACANKAKELKDNGYYPDLIVGHSGWGELLFLKEVWPKTKFLTYVEFNYTLENSDIDFDPTVFMDKSPYTRRKLIARNSPFYSQYFLSDKMITPTHFQRNTFPSIFKKNIDVIQEGIDTNLLKPKKDSALKINNITLTDKSKVVLFVSRTLEPYRGYHSFIRSIPGILDKHPDAYILLIGGDDGGYGASPETGTTHRENFFNEIKDKVDTSRIFFLGYVDYEILVTCFNVSSVHVYLTYPFVLSWSMLESMSCGSLILGSNTGPVTEVIKDNINGLLVDFFDYDAISKKINNILEKPEDYLNIRAKARETIIKEYDLWSVCIPKHKNLVEQMLNE